MGTRNLTAVMINGEYKIAQYGQWNGYPSGQGLTTLNFARKLGNPDFRKEFEKKLLSACWITDEKIAEVNKEIQSGRIRNIKEIYPELSRDTGAEILEIVKSYPAGIMLANNINFAADGLFCEWAWVIDLDKNTFEGYTGFNEELLNENDRFYFLKDEESETSGYHGIRLIAEWDLDNLPMDDEFFKAFEEQED